jgi:AraC-like DNA-binding protein
MTQRRYVLALHCDFASWRLDILSFKIIYLSPMPIYMDVHIVPGVKAKDVAEAHRKDLLHQGEFGCNCMTYWIDEKRDSIFCLIEAVDKDAVKEMHSKAHGLVPHKIVEVSSTIVESFLGRIYDPEDAATTADGLKVFADPSFRILLVTKINDPVLLQHQLGEEKANALLARYHAANRKHIAASEGSEVEHGGDGLIASFTSAARAISCAMAIRKELAEEDISQLDLRIAINGGEPIEKSNKLFGDTIQLAQQLCTSALNGQIAVSTRIKEMAPNDILQQNKKYLKTLSPQDEEFLQSLFNRLEEKWQDPQFGIEDYSKAVAMSQSQLYRKITALTGVSGNVLLKDYRLEKAKELMKKQRLSISQVTFESGFSSPSYFTKCFKQKYGLLPMGYVELLD